MSRVLPAHQVVGHGRHKRTRENERPDQRKHHRFRQRPEQVAGDAAELEHRDEDDAQAKQRDECRNNDLLRAIEDRLPDLLTLFEVIVDVLDGHGPVVDQNADGERQPAERHHVDGLAKPRQRGKREKYRQRNLDENDDGRAPAAEEYQNHHADEQGRQRRLANDAEYGRLDENRLIADGMQIEARRQRRLDARQQRFDPVNDVERRGRSRLEYRHQHRARAVDAHEVGLRRRAFMHVADVAHEDDRVVDLLDRQIVDSLQHDRAGVERHVPVELADLGVAGRQNQVLRPHGVEHVVGGNAMGLHALLVEIDLHLQNLAAIGRGNGGAGDGRELRANEILAEIEQLHLRQLFAGKCELQDRHARGVVAQHVGRGDARRQQLEHGLRSGGHLRQGLGDIDVLLKENLDHAVAGERLRFDVLDIGDLGGQVAFVIIDDAARHVVGRQTIISPHHADDRNIDVGKDVGWRGNRRAHAENGDDDGQHDEGVGASERGEDDPHVR